VAARRFRFHAEADAELGAAADWYERRRAGLGLVFLAAVRHRIDQILESPYRWRLVRGTRRALVGSLPYAVGYGEANESEIEVVAVAHLKRKAGYWRRR
jgi:hypothetical protein